MAENEKTLKIELGHVGEISVSIKPDALRLIPKEARDHMREANRQALMGLRFLLDRAIDHMGPDKDQPSSGATRVKVEVEE